MAAGPFGMSCTALPRNAKFTLICIRKCLSGQEFSWFIDVLLFAFAGTTPLRIAVDLSDGSHITGVPAVCTLKFKASFAEVDIPL